MPAPLRAFSKPQCVMRCFHAATVWSVMVSSSTQALRGRSPSSVKAWAVTALYDVPRWTLAHWTVPPSVRPNEALLRPIKFPKAGARRPQSLLAAAAYFPKSQVCAGWKRLPAAYCQWPPQSKSAAWPSPRVRLRRDHRIEAHDFACRGRPGVSPPGAARGQPAARAARGRPAADATIAPADRGGCTTVDCRLQRRSPRFTGSCVPAPGPDSGRGAPLDGGGTTGAPRLLAAPVGVM
jgi:hypothetical protein